MILYCSIIFFTVLLISLFSFLILGNGFFITFGYAWLAVLYELLLNGIVAFFVEHCVPNKCFNNGKFYQTSKKELKFYNFLKIKCWKDKVLELGGLGGFRKNKLQSSKDEEYLHKFILEIDKGIAIHFYSIFACILLILIPPLFNLYYITIPIIVVSIILNLMPLFILKYTRPRINKLIQLNNVNKEK